MKFKVVALAASTGGPQALTYIFRHLPVHLPAAYLIVQHLPPSFTRYFADGLAKKTSIEVQVATDGLPLRPGLALIAPSGAHLMVQSAASKHGWCVLLSQEPAVGGHRPSADPLFSSVALACSKMGVGVILTGMGSDGANGLLQLRRAGGITLGQDAASSIVFGMPRAAYERGAVQKLLPLSALPSAIAEAVLAP